MIQENIFFIAQKRIIRARIADSLFVGCTSPVCAHSPIQPRFYCTNLFNRDGIVHLGDFFHPWISLTGSYPKRLRVRLTGRSGAGNHHL
jgi:hypothetical protein